MNAPKLGQYNRLKVVKEVDFGVYLDGGDAGEILLPQRYVPEHCNTGDELEVFVYLDQEERIIATTEQPLAQVGDFAYLEVAWVNQHGAFLNWGLMKDLFCPFREQKKRMEIGQAYIVHVHLDKESYRIMASAKVEHYLTPYDASLPIDQQPLKLHQEVELLVWQKTELGFKVIINNRFAGLVYASQVFQPIHTGDRLKGYIDAIRPDGKIDVTLQPTGRRQTEEFAETLLQYLKENDGFCNLGDKSDAEDIKRCFQVSKKTYKRAISDLYKRRLITIEPDGIRMVIED